MKTLNIKKSLSLSIIFAGPTRSNDTAKPRKKGMESFSIRNIFCAERLCAATSSKRLTTSLEIQVDVLVRIIVYIRIVQMNRFDDMLRAAYCRYLMEVGCLTVYRLKVRIVLFLDADGVLPCVVQCILEQGEDRVLWLCMTDG